MKNISTSAVVLMLAIAVSACGGNGSDDGTGRISLSVTDAPVDHAQALYLTIHEFTLQGEQGSVTQGPFGVPSENQLVNLMDFQGTEGAVLVRGLEVDPGTYKLRLDVDLAFSDSAADRKSWIEFAAGDPECAEPLPGDAVWTDDTKTTCVYRLEIPSGEQAGFRPKGDVTVTAGGTSSFTVEFDLRRNVVDPSNPSDVAYKLKPTGLRLVNDTVVGTIFGSVDAALLTDTCQAENAHVYLYDRTGATEPFVPDDMHEGNTTLVTSVPVREEAGKTFHYLIGFVLPGTYAVAFTCQEDDSIANEDLAFPSEADAVVVLAGGDTRQDL